jgi:hypothetical protein
LIELTTQYPPDLDLEEVTRTTWYSSRMVFTVVQFELASGIDSVEQARLKASG